MGFDLKKQMLPKIFQRCGRECYLDEIRKKLIYVTPEETVRQKVISYLVNDLNVPENMIVVEEPLSHYKIPSNKRADIIIHKLNTEENTLMPIAVIECKAPNVELDVRAGNQMMHYADELLCDFTMLTNGYKTFSYFYDEEENQYLAIDELPTYGEMLDNKYCIIEESELPQRIPFYKLKESLNSYIGFDIGKDTDREKAAPCINLLECLLDTRVKFPSKEFQLFRVIEDYGVRILSYGDASGGIFNGPYRSFLLDVNGNIEFVSFGFSQYSTWAKQDVVKTALNVAIDNERNCHHSLQFVIDENMTVKDSICTFTHHGRIGSGKIGELLKFVQNRYPKIVNRDRFNLGTLTHNRLWRLDDKEVIVFLENLISYALIRDEYRTYVKGTKVKVKK